jgi:hypothetical protein
VRIYYRGNSIVIEVHSIKDQEDNLISGAVVEASLTLPDGSAVPGVTNPVTLSPASGGKYIGMVPPIYLSEGSLIVVEVVAVESGVTATCVEEMVIKGRTFTNVSARC